jgi:hypothetical protein
VYVSIVREGAFESLTTLGNQLLHVGVNT